MLKIIGENRNQQDRIQCGKGKTCAELFPSKDKDRQIDQEKERSRFHRQKSV